MKCRRVCWIPSTPYVLAEYTLSSRSARARVVYSCGGGTDRRSIGHRAVGQGAGVSRARRERGGCERSSRCTSTLVIGVVGMAATVASGNHRTIFERLSVRATKPDVGIGAIGGVSMRVSRLRLAMAKVRGEVKVVRAYALGS